MIGTRAEWLAARRELLEQEKELTRRSDELARQRQRLPWFPSEGLQFEGPIARRLGDSSRALASSSTT